MKIAKSLVSVLLVCFTWLDRWRSSGNIEWLFTYTPHFPRCICYIKSGPSGKTEIPPEEQQPDREAWKTKLVAVYCPAMEKQLKPHGEKKTKQLWGKMSWTRCFLKTERNCGTSDLVWWSSCDMNNVPKWKKQPLRLHMFPNSHNRCFTMHFLSGTWVEKGGSSPPHPPPILMQ